MGKQRHALRTQSNYYVYIVQVHMQHRDNKI